MIDERAETTTDTPDRKTKDSGAPETTGSILALFDAPSLAFEPDELPFNGLPLADPGPARVKGTILDALSAANTHQDDGLSSADNISAIHCDDNGLYHFFRGH